MTNKIIFSIALVLLVIASSMIFLFPAGTGSIGNATPSQIPGGFLGTITIAPNGTVVYNGVGDTSIVTQSGNYYTLTNTVDGEISIEHNGTVLNGLNSLITTYGPSPTPEMLNISNVSGVNVTNLTMTSASETGIYIENASNIQVSKVNVSAFEYAVQILANTEYINVSNSILSFDKSSSLNLSTASVGVSVSPNFGAITYLSTSHNNNFFNDTVYNSIVSGYPYSLISNSTNSVFRDMHFIGPAIYGAQLSASNESMVDSTFSGAIESAFMAVYSLSPLKTTNISLVGNTFNIDRLSSQLTSELEVIVSYDQTNISNNVVTVNNTLAKSSGPVTGISLISRSPNGIGVIVPTATGNAIHTDVPANIPYFAANGSLVTDNTVSIVGSASSFASMIGIGSAYAGNVTLSDNTVAITNSSNAEGIVDLLASNVTVTQNKVLSHDSSVMGLYAGSVQNSSLSQNTVLGDNTTTGVGTVITKGQNDTISDNTISDFQLDLGSSFSGNLTFNGNYLENSNTSVYLNNTNYSVIYHNVFTGYSYEPANITNSTHLMFNESYPVGGNYWSGYTGTASANGFGSTPFDVAPGYKDYLPLTSKWTRPQAVFTETGLPSGIIWSVTFGGQTAHTNLDSITFNIQNGAYMTYNYTINAPSGFYSGIENGSYNYTGASTTTAVVFTHYAYLNGSILPHNATVMLNGILMNNLTNGSFNISIKAGSYELIVNETGYNTYYLNFTVLPGQTEHVNVSLNRTSNLTTGYYLIGGGAAVIAAVGIASVLYRRRNGA